MSQHIKIKTSTDNNVHFDTHVGGYTLCGLETGGDEDMHISVGKTVKAKVNCRDCIRIVKYCKNISEKEFINAPN